MRYKKQSSNANYDFEKQVAPMRRMGEGDFANLPSQPFCRPLNNKFEQRDGLINSFQINLDEDTGVSENQR